jgi:hypothetical protein
VFPAPLAGFNDVFFLPRQCAFDAARMGRDSEPLLNGCGQFYGPNGRIA